MPWIPSTPGEVPTLGYVAIDFMTEYLAAPDRLEYEPFVPYAEQEDFILRWYAINPVTGAWCYRRGLLGRSRGWGKSPLLAALGITEALAPIVPAGWDADGQPVGRPWSDIRTPNVHIAAVSEAQVKNTWDPMLEMLEGPVIDAYPGLEPLGTFVNLPKGKIIQLTSSARTTKGAKPVFAVLDQTEEWVPSNGGPKLAQTIRSNAAKIGGRTLESPNAFTPGEGSVAEDSAAFAKAIADGRTLSSGLLLDHREAPAETDLADRESLVAGLRVAYGDSSGHPDGCVLHDPPCAPGHVELEPIIEQIWDPTADVQLNRSDFLNQITHASDSWISRPEWNSRSTHVLTPDAPLSLQAGDSITLGFDGSRKRKRGVTDATALVACRVSDGLLVPMKVWEQPDGPAGDDWRIPTDEVDTLVRETFATYNVVGFYADPAKWEGYVAQWEAKYGARLKVQSTRTNPIEWWMVGGRAAMITRALEQFYNAVVDGELVHAGDSTLTAHVLNARRRMKQTGYQIFKAHPDSPDKIDAAIAAVLAWQARIDAVGAGLGTTRKRRAPRRLR